MFSILETEKRRRIDQDEVKWTRITLDDLDFSLSIAYWHWPPIFNIICFPNHFLTAAEYENMNGSYELGLETKHKLL